MSFGKTSPTLARALAEHDYNDATPVQAAVLAKQAEGRDVVVSAQTGSGKTVAYGLAIAPDILDPEGKFNDVASPLALIIAPTRELAMQVERELRWLYSYTGVKIVACVGGMDPREERRKLGQGAHIVVGTPGRLRDHIERRGLVMESLAAVVLDEADEMLDLGFREDLEFILEATPEARRTLLFSATIPKGIATLAKKYQRDALRIEVAAGEKGHADIEYRAIRVAFKEHEHAVVNLLRFVDAQTSIVFCNTREAVRHLQATLLERGFNAVLLSGELSQHERNQSMQALRDGRARVCVATDVAARGIDLPNLGLVIHAELPHDAEALQHRSGRTGRAGRKGVSAILVPAPKRRKAEQLMRDAGVRPIWSGPPTAEEIKKLDQERLINDPIFDEAPSEDDVAMAQLMLAQRTPEQLCAALVRMYRARLPGIEDVSDPGDGPLRREPRDVQNSSTAPKTFKTGEFKSSSKGRAIPDGVWFRLDIGRKKNADPKWLLPMLCRKGEITKSDIGAIRIFEHETKVEIAGAVAKSFAVNIRKPGGENIKVDRLEGDDGRESAPAPVRHEAPKFDGPKYEPVKRESVEADKVAFAKPKFEKPKFDKPRFDGPKGDKPRYEGQKPGFQKKFEGPKKDKPKFEGKKYEGPKKGGGPKPGTPNPPGSKADKPRYVSKADRKPAG